MIDLKQRQTAFLLQCVFPAQALISGVVFFFFLSFFLNTHAHVHTPLQSTEIM